MKGGEQGGGSTCLPRRGRAPWQGGCKISKGQKQGYTCETIYEGVPDCVSIFPSPVLVGCIDEGPASSLGGPYRPLGHAKGLGELRGNRSLVDDVHGVRVQRGVLGMSYG